LILGFLINFGPQHPSTHGVLRLISILYGEIIQWITLFLPEFMLFVYLLVFYSMILFSVTSIFSLCFSNPYILLSDNFECGFYPILLSMLKYKLNYWILTIYFLIFEQELILVLLLTFSMKTLNENIILCFLLGLLFLDLLLWYF